MIYNLTKFLIGRYRGAKAAHAFWTPCVVRPSDTTSSGKSLVYYVDDEGREIEEKEPKE